MTHSADPSSIPLADVNVIQPMLFYTDQHWPYFARLRKEDPVHLNHLQGPGRIWSVTKYRDIVKVDTDHSVFSSAQGITIVPTYVDKALATCGGNMIIASDPPKHGVLRATLSPLFETQNIAGLESAIRRRAGRILDSLPLGETFDWVAAVAVEFTVQMLAELFDIPFEDRLKLARWSDVTTALPGSGLFTSPQQRQAELDECLAYFTRLWHKRSAGRPGGDFVSLLAHGEDTRHMPPEEYLGNLTMLLVAGNDTTRHSVTGSVLALHRFPGEWRKLRDDHARVHGMVDEAIRWQTPLAYMCRTALCDTVLGGKNIEAGDRLIMWYISGNRDEDIFASADHFLADRPNAHRHLSFGYGIHRCMGRELAALQLRVLWQEILRRFARIEVVQAPARTFSAFVHGYTSLSVKLHPLT